MADHGLVRFKRWRRVVNGSFQYRAIALSLLVVLVGSILFFAALAGYYWLVSPSNDRSMEERLEEALPMLFANAAVIMLLVVVVGRFASLRVAGPIFRICRDVDRVLSGETRVRVDLRRGDAFPELADKVNALIEQIDTTEKG